MECLNEANKAYGVKPVNEFSLSSMKKMTGKHLESANVFQNNLILSAEITPHGAIDAAPLMQKVLTVLAELSHDGRWIALIAPPNVPYVATLLAYDIDLRRVLLVHPKDDDKSFTTIERALRAGTCGAVVAWTQLLDARSLRRLRQAAVQGQAFGVMLHQNDTESIARSMPRQMTLGLESEGFSVPC